jgi:hypothetical protein
VELLDALSAKNSQMIGAVEVLHSLRMHFAQLLCDSFLVLIIELEVSLCEDGVFLNNFVEDINVEGQSFSAL